MQIDRLQSLLVESGCHVIGERKSGLQDPHEVSELGERFARINRVPSVYDSSIPQEGSISPGGD